MTALYEMKYPKGVLEVLEQLRERIATVAGVTLVGNRLTVRWNMGGQMVAAHMIIENVTTVREAEVSMCDHPVHDNSGLLIPCPACGATAEERMAIK